jgi:uncharacterized protein (TIGR02266 family)
MREHRKHERIPLRMTIEYRSDDTGDHFLMESTQNVSEGGIFIETRDPAPIGTRLEVAFTLPGSGERILAAGTVVWVNEWREEGPNPNPGMGIRWDALDEAHRVAITEIVKTIAIVPQIPEAPSASPS